jgi:hypothetical protein
VKTVVGVFVVSEKNAEEYKSIAFIGVESMPLGKLFVNASDKPPRGRGRCFMKLEKLVRQWSVETP